MLLPQMLHKNKDNRKKKSKQTAHLHYECDKQLQNIFFPFILMKCWEKKKM